MQYIVTRRFVPTERKGYFVAISRGEGFWATDRSRATRFGRGEAERTASAIRACGRKAEVESVPSAPRVGLCAVIALAADLAIVGAIHTVRFWFG